MHIQNALKNKVTQEQSHLQESVQWSRIKKFLQRTYTMESIDSYTDLIFASFNLEEIINEYSSTVGKLTSLLTFLNVNLRHIICFYLKVSKQMTDVKLLLLHRNSSYNSTICKQMR